MKYLKFYSRKAVKPSTLSSIIHFQLQKKINKNSARQKLSQKVSKFEKITKVYSQQSFSTSGICL